MPLIKSSSEKAVGQNISREVAAGRPQKQAIAIAMSVKREAAKRAGKRLKGMTRQGTVEGRDERG